MEAVPIDTNRPRTGPAENHIYSRSTNISPSRPTASHQLQFYSRQTDPPQQFRHEDGHAPGTGERRDTNNYANDRKPLPPSAIAHNPPYSSDPSYHRNSHAPHAPPPPPPPPPQPPPVSVALTPAPVALPPRRPSSRTENQRSYSHILTHQDKKPSMDASYNQQAYYIPPQHHPDSHRPHGIITQGLPPEHSAGHAFASMPYSAPPFMQSTGLPGDPMQGYNTSTTSQTARRERPKAVRAQQACDNCRQRKARCDEGRPVCSNCSDNNIICNYRDVPMPKSDRQIGDVSKKLDAVSDTVERLERFIMQRLGGPLPHQDRNGVSHVQSPARNDRPSQSPTLNQGFHPVYPEDAEISDHQESQSQFRPHLDRNMETNGYEDIEETGEDLSIPREHTTGAHNLLLYWSSMKSFFGGIEEDEDYVMNTEESRGLLRLYGRGEGRELDNRLAPFANLSRPRQEPGLSSSPGHRKYTGPDEGSSTASSPDGRWGIPAIYTSHSDSNYLKPYNQVGGIGSDGGLVMNEDVVRSLYASYLANIHIMQPFLDKRKMDQVIETFIKTYSPRSCPISPKFAVPHYGTAIVNSSDSPRHNKQPKRKREDDSVSGSPINGDNSQRTPIWPERSITNAIVLFILALGKISQVKEPLASWRLPIDPTSNLNSPRSAVDSPPTHVRSPLPTNTYRSTSAPSEQNRANFGLADGRRSPSNTIPSFEKRDPKLRNVDIIPGLAYYSYAASILGELFGGNTLFHMHANILAGLYNAQLIRVLDSWKYINQACIICQVLIKQSKKREQDLTTSLAERHKAGKPGPNKYIDQLLLGFWTCTQLEGDILAELDQLPHSGMSRLEDKMMLPTANAFESDLPSEQQNLIAHYYLSQIYLRKILNRMHQALYNTAHNNKRKGGWGKLRAEDLMDSLSSWRQRLPKELQWEDNDKPSTDINAARMRGKYYGAVYAVHRPFLRFVLESSSDSDSSEFSSWGPGRAATGSNDPPRSKEDLKRDRFQYFLSKAEDCVKAATQSTVAFDGVLFSNNNVKRMIVTNLFGTASAQFGNVLVLAATIRHTPTSYLENKLSPYNFPHLMNRTITFLKSLAPLSPTFQIDVKVLEQTRAILQNERAQASEGRQAKDTSSTPHSAPNSAPNSAHSSFTYHNI